MADPLDDTAARALAFAFDKPVLRRVALPADIEAACERLYGEGRSSAERLGEAAGERDDDDRDADLERLQDLASEAPVIRLVNGLVSRAVEMRASDIHLESAEARLRVRYRIDGALAEIEPPPARLRQRHHLAGEDHGATQHRRAAAGAGWSDAARGARQGDRFPRLDHALDSRRERRAAHPRSRRPVARLR